MFWPRSRSLRRTSLALLVIVFATTAGTPYIFDKSLFAAHPRVLNISLRDLSPEIILSADNVVDDADHCLRANTSLHLAEWRQQSPPRGVLGASVRRPDGSSEWIGWTDVIENSDDFEWIGAAFESAVGMSAGQVGDAKARLMRQRVLVDFATAWMADHRPVR